MNAREDGWRIAGVLPLHTPCAVPLLRTGEPYERNDAWHLTAVFFLTAFLESCLSYTRLAQLTLPSLGWDAGEKRVLNTDRVLGSTK